MATTETTEKVAQEPEKAVEEKAVPPPEGKTSAYTVPTKYFALLEVVLRFLLFASALVAVVVIVTSKQTKRVPLPFPPFQLATRDAKFNQSPAYIYFVAALSVTGFYAIISTLLSFYSLLKPGCFANSLSHFVIIDVLLLGIVASATGAAGGVGYIGLKGNSHAGWMKVCNIYDKFCRHIAASIAVSLFGSIVLLLLVLLSVYALSKKIPK